MENQNDNSATIVDYGLNNINSLKYLPLKSGLISNGNNTTNNDTNINSNAIGLSSSTTSLSAQNYNTDLKGNQISTNHPNHTFSSSTHTNNMINNIGNLSNSPVATTNALINDNHKNQSANFYSSPATKNLSNFPATRIIVNPSNYTPLLNTTTTNMPNMPPTNSNNNNNNSNMPPLATTNILQNPTTITTTTNTTTTPSTTVMISPLGPHQTLINSNSNFNTDNTMMKPLGSVVAGASILPTTTTTITTTTLAKKNLPNDKFINIGLESIKVNGAVQFKQLRNPLHASTKESNSSSSKENLPLKECSRAESQKYNYNGNVSTPALATTTTTTTTTTTSIVKPNEVLNKTSANNPNQSVVAQQPSVKSAKTNTPNVNLFKNSSLESIEYSDETQKFNNDVSSKLTQSVSNNSNNNFVNKSSQPNNSEKEKAFYNHNGSVVILNNLGSINYTSPSVAGMANSGAGSEVYNLGINGGNNGGAASTGAGSNGSNGGCNNGGNGQSDNENTVLCQSPRLTLRSSTSNVSNRKEKKTSVGYRLGKRKLLFEKRRQISDYALIFAMTGVFLMIIETEFSMSRLYSKVKCFWSRLKK